MGVNWEAIGAVGEVGGAVAVVATLIYLAVQIRQNTRGLLEAASRETTAQYERLVEGILGDPKQQELYEIATGDPMSALENPAGLDADDLRRYALFMYRFFNAFHMQHRAWRSGTLADADWDKVAPLVRTFTATEASRDYWRWARDWFDAEFVAFVDGEIEGRTPGAIGAER